MQRDYAYRKLQDLLPQKLQHKQLLATHGAVEDFLRLAAATGFYLPVQVSARELRSHGVGAALSGRDPERGGMQIPVADPDGDGNLDFVVARKSGLFLFVNKGK